MTTTGALLRSVEVVQHELQQMEDVLRDAPRNHVCDSDRRLLRSELIELRRRFELLMEWLSAARLEETRQ